MVQINIEPQVATAGEALIDLIRIVESMAEEAFKAGVKIVTGDTKVVEKGKCDKLFITTSGIGLGLSVNKQLLDMLGGKIKINTSPNQGTEVIFIIPFKCKKCQTSLQSPISHQ